MSTNETMKLKELKISLIPSYREDAGKYTAEVEYEGVRGSTKMVMDAKVSEALLAFIGPTIAAFAHQSCLQLEASINQSIEEAKKSPAIEMQKEAK